VPVECDVESLSDELPEALEAVTRQGLRKLGQVLRTLLDVTDASLTRNQVTAAAIANRPRDAWERDVRCEVMCELPHIGFRWYLIPFPPSSPGKVEGFDARRAHQ